MIELGPVEGDFPAVAAEARGGFVWWYADLFDGQGNGVVCIWSFGLPFLPGYAASEKRGEADAAQSRPSVTLSVYQEGREDFYLFTEIDPEDCTWGTDSWQFGGFSAELDRDSGLRLKLDLPVPGSEQRLVASMSLEGSLRQGSGQNRSPSHSWEPILLGKVTGAFEGCVGDKTFDITGRGYHDRNAGDQALHRLGIQNWRWFRISYLDKDLVLYLLDPDDPSAASRNIAFEVDKNGQVKMLEVASVRHSKNAWSWVGPRWPTRTTVTWSSGVELAIAHEELVDSGPFYQRTLVRVDGEEQGYGVAELVLPNQIDRDMERWLVRMRVHRQSGRNSMWLPLFSGPKSGRWGRLFSHWAGVRPDENQP